MFTNNNTKRTPSSTSEIPNADLMTQDITDDTVTLEDLENRLSVRFFLKRSKNFHYDRFGRDLIKERENRTNLRKNSENKRNLYIGGESVPTTDILRYIKRLSVRIEAKKMIPIKKQKLKESMNFEFSIPKVFACHKCSKLLFHKLAYRRHMIFHMSHKQHCKKCNKAFAIKSDRRKHEAVCRKKKMKSTIRN